MIEKEVDTEVIQETPQVEIKTYHQTDEFGLFLYSQDFASRPFGGVTVPPPEAPEGKVAQWSSALNVNDMSYGDENTGLWKLVDDHRKTEMYLIGDGTKYEYDSSTEQGSFNGIGNVPNWLTSEPKPDQFHYWKDGKWTLDEAAKLEADKTAERSWRDNRINSIMWIRDRHRDELDADLPTTLTKAEYGQLLTYIQALRDWPASPDFPVIDKRPTAPDFLSAPSDASQEDS